MRKFAIISSVLCLVLLAAALVAVDPARLRAAWQSITPAHIITALLAVQVQIIASAYRWQFTARRLGHDIATRLAIQEYYLSSALNLVLPGGMAGDAVRAYRSRRADNGGWKRPAAAVVLERASGQLAFFVLCCLGLLAWPMLLQNHVPAEYDQLLWLAAVLLAMLTVIGLAFRRAWLPERILRLGPELKTVFFSSGAWLVQAGLSLLILSAYIATFMIASAAVGAPLPLLAAFTIIPLCLLTMLIPAGVGGWGTREAAAATLWPVLGFTSAEGLAASLLYGLLSLFGAAVPGLLSLVLSLTKRA